MNVLQNHVRHTPQYLYFVYHLRSKLFDNLLMYREQPFLIAIFYTVSQTRSSAIAERPRDASCC